MSRCVPWQLLRISLKRKLAYTFVPFFPFPSFCCSECGWDGSIRSSHFGRRGGRAWWKKIKWIWFPEDFFSPTIIHPEPSCFRKEGRKTRFRLIFFPSVLTTMLNCLQFLRSSQSCSLLYLATCCFSALCFIVSGGFLLTKTHFKNLLLWKDCSFTAGRVW